MINFDIFKIPRDGVKKQVNYTFRSPTRGSYGQELIIINVGVFERDATTIDIGTTCDPVRKWPFLIASARKEGEQVVAADSFASLRFFEIPNPRR